MNTTSVIISTITMMVAITSAEAVFIPTSPCTMIQPSISHHSIIEPTHPIIISAGGCYSSTNSCLLAYQERSRYDQKGVVDHLAVLVTTTTKEDGQMILCLVTLIMMIIEVMINLKMISAMNTLHSSKSNHAHQIIISPTNALEKHHHYHLHQQLYHPPHQHSTHKNHYQIQPFPYYRIKIKIRRIINNSFFNNYVMQPIYHAHHVSNH